MSLDDQANKWNEECKKQINDDAHVWTYYKKFAQHQAIWCICGSTAPSSNVDKGQTTIDALRADYLSWTFQKAAIS
ncbi:hypothetical protein CBOM_05101 [Ceraceosorus bombacis]|uniref:Uncharacterized protein n=1 Tax=Ceraceosorus bombacis TaxID=401625 RepID=A0A0P1BHS9_9BASI|nr:hypothetical protein CBOM_05101 [Ceraceosorus bombacis]